MKAKSDKSAQRNDVQRAAQLEQQASQPRTNIVMEFLDFLVHNKKWWLTPILLVLLLFGALLVLSGTGAAPFIYTLF